MQIFKLFCVDLHYNYGAQGRSAAFESTKDICQIRQVAFSGNSSSFTPFALTTSWTTTVQLKRATVCVFSPIIMLLNLSLSVICALFSLVSARNGGFYDNIKSVLTLTQTNFGHLVEQSPKAVLVEFYSPNCGHCVQLKDTWKALASDLTPHIPVGAINCQDEQGLCGRYSIRGVPAIKLFTRDERGKMLVMDFNEGKRDRTTIGNWAKRLAPSHVQKVSNVKKDDSILNLEQFLNKQETLPHVLLVKRDTMVATLAYKTLSVEFRDRVVVGIASGKGGFDLANQADIEVDGDEDVLVVFPSGGAKGFRYGEKIAYTSLHEYMERLAKGEIDSRQDL